MASDASSIARLKGEITPYGGEHAESSVLHQPALDPSRTERRAGPNYSSSEQKQNDARNSNGNHALDQADVHIAVAHNFFRYARVRKQRRGRQPSEEQQQDQAYDRIEAEKREAAGPACELAANRLEHD